MTKKRIICLILFILLASQITAFAQINSDDLLEKADSVRGPDAKFTFLIKVIDYKNGKKEYENVLRVNVHDISRSLAEYIEPLSDRGKKLLMLQENYWFYSPTSKRPIRITPQQRLLGQASNGDIATTNYRNDYSSKLIGIDKIQAYDSGEVKECHKLDLNKKTEAATYHRILYWIEKDTFKPLKAEFYVRSGKLLKTAYFINYKMNMGIERPGTTVLINGIHKTQITEMHYGQYSISDLPASKYQSSQLTN